MRYMLVDMRIQLLLHHRSGRIEESEDRALGEAAGRVNPRSLLENTFCGGLEDTVWTQEKLVYQSHLVRRIPGRSRGKPSSAEPCNLTTDEIVKIQLEAKLTDR